MLMLALPREQRGDRNHRGARIGLRPAGRPIMSLPARVLQPATRAIGMGIFYTVYYGTMMLGPVVGGRLRQMGRQCGGGVRFRRRGAAGLPAAAVGLQPDRGIRAGIARSCLHMTQSLLTAR